MPHPLPKAGGPASLSPASATDPAHPQIDQARIQQALRLGADYLVSSVGPDGKFVYRINLDPKVRVKPSYNMLRHAGTMYALATYHQRWPTPATRDALERASGFLRRFMAPIPEHESAHAIWEDDLHEEAKLGGASLALVALVALEQAVPGSANLNELSRLGAFITFMQKPNGGFFSKYYADRGGRSDAWTSLYYPGEAALGLLMLHDLAPATGSLEAAVNALGFLAEQRRGRARVEPDHWALIATGRLFSDYAHAEWPRDKGLLKIHALQICESVLDVEQDLDRSSPMFGAFDRDGRTTPAATRLEGLLAALPLLQDTYDAELKQRARTAIDAGIQFLLNVQRREGDHRGAVPRAARSSNRRATEVRIDYVQHAMSAWMGYLDLLETEASQPRRPPSEAAAPLDEDTLD